MRSTYEILQKGGSGVGCVFEYSVYKVRTISGQYFAYYVLGSHPLTYDATIHEEWFGEIVRLAHYRKTVISSSVDDLWGATPLFVLRFSDYSEITIRSSLEGEIMLKTVVIPPDVVHQESKWNDADMIAFGEWIRSNFYMDGQPELIPYDRERYRRGTIPKLFEQFLKGGK